jgi:hypothetical protein
MTTLGKAERDANASNFELRLSLAAIDCIPSEWKEL